MWYRNRRIMVMWLCALVLTLFAVPASSVQASVNIPFNHDDHAGKYVQMGGRKWIVVEVVDGKPLLMMDSTYGSIPWNSGNDSSDASKIMQYLDDHFDQIITVAEDRDKIAVTEWEIFSKSGLQPQYYTDVQGKPIDPPSFSQKLAISPLDVYTKHCSIVKNVMTDPLWTLSPYQGSQSEAYVAWLTPGPGGGVTCGFGRENVTISKGIQPALYLNNTVTIRGGTGSEGDPYVLSVTSEPVAANIEANGTTDHVTVQHVPAGATVRVYAANGSTQIGMKDNGGSPGTVSIKVTSDLRLGDKVYVSFTQPGKAESGKVEATVIDNDPPTILLSAPTTPTNLTVTVTATITDGGSDIVERKWVQGDRDAAYFRVPGQGTAFTGNSFVVSTNDVYTVYAKDAAGNDGVAQITIDNFDHTAPTLFDVHISSSNMRSEKLAKVGDEILLTFTASEALGALPQVTIAGQSATVTSTGGLAYRAAYTMQDSDPEDIITFTIQYRDVAGNTGDPVTENDAPSQIKFDRTPPAVPSLSADITAPTQENVAVTVVCPGDAYDCLYKLDDDDLWSDYTGPIMMNDNGIVYALAVDEAGNKSDTAEYTVDNIDREAPTVFDVSITSSNENPVWAKVGDEIKLTFKASEALSALPVVTIAEQPAAVTSIGANAYEATYTMQETDPEEMVAFTIDYTDLAGLDGKQEVETSDETYVEFDRTAPVDATFDPDDTLPTNQDVTVSIDYPSDAHLRQFRTSEHEPWTEYAAPVVMRENGAVYARSIDPAGNVSAVSSYAVSNIDKVLPIIEPPVLTPDTLTNQNVTVTVAVYDLANDIVDTRWAIGVQSVDYFDLGGTTFDGSFIVKMNGNYTIYALDEAGNGAVTAFTVSNIFREEPEITLTAKPTVPTTGSVTVTASVYALHGVEVQKFDFGHHPREYFVAEGKPLGLEPIEMTDNGWVTVYVRDPAGNETVEHLEITNIDRDKPVLTLQGDAQMRIRRGSKFTDPGATAWDDHDGDLSDKIVVSGDAVDPNRSGTYQMAYRVVDRAGNEADPVTRTVIVYTPSDGQPVIPPNIVDVPDEPDEPVDENDPIETGDEEVQPVTFSDIANHWAEQAMQQAAQSGIISGYPDGTFRPDNPITRAEFIVMLVHAMGLEDAEAEPAFVDQQQIGSWAKRAIALALKRGIVQGYEDGSFRPDRQITRAEMSAMIARAIGLTEEAVAQTNFTDDEEIPSWAKAAVEGMRRQGIIQGRGDNYFVPNASATRAEAAVIMLSLIRIMEA